MKINITFFTLAVIMFTTPAVAQKKYNGIRPDTAKVHYIHTGNIQDAYIFNSELHKNTIYVNEQVTTHILMPEPIKMVDISTNSIVGNQCADNIVRIKPAGRMYDKELAGTITVIGERHIAQFNVVYVNGPARANTIFNIHLNDIKRYTNPSVLMPASDMVRMAWGIYGMPAHFHNISYKKYGMKATVNNIFAINDYFFIDFSLYNKTNIKFDIDDIRIKLRDKKETKATNSQTIELTPVYTLNSATSFKRGYRNVIVLNKLTFPDEKILYLEICEKQISGRIIYIPIEYSDLLHADSFDKKLMDSLSNLK